MSLSSYLLRRFLRNPREALRLKRAGDEIGGYIAWRLYAELQEAGLLKAFEERPWWDFNDKELARLVQDILVEEGLARRSGDTIRAVKAPERPEITTGEAADMIPVLDKALQLLPEVLESGKKPEYSRVKALTAKLVGSFGVRLEFEAAVEVSGLDKLPESSVVLDVFPRVGTSTATLLELTRAGILAVEPYPENLEVLEGLVKLQGVGDRVRLVHAAPLESMRIQERVDAAFMGEVLHWTPSPQMVLRAVRNHMKRDSFLVLAQTVYSSLGMKVGLLGYLLGALRLPPTSGELRSMLRVAGFKVDKWLESMGVALVRARPMVTFV